MEKVYSTEILEFKQENKPTKYWQGHVLRYDGWFYYQISEWYAGDKIDFYKPKECDNETHARIRIDDLYNELIPEGYAPEKKLESIKFEITLGTIGNIIRENNPECYEGMTNSEMVKEWLESIIQGEIDFEANELKLVEIKEVE